MSSGPALSVRDLHVHRRSSRVEFRLEVPALDLAAGEALAVLGPNGAGKSTLLRALAGLEVLQAGRVERGTAGAVTMVFQRPVAFAGTVAHNVRVGLAGRGLRHAEVERRALQSLERFGIAHLAPRRAAALSAGELRRLALARALALKPEVLLLDEPFDDLDAAAQEALSLDLRRTIEDTGVAVAVVTHDLRHALLLADRIAVLLAGRLAQLGSRDEVLTRPASPEVARGVGMANLLPGRIAAERDGELGWVAIDPTHRIAIRTALAPGTPVWVGLRPEELKLDVGRGEGLPIGKGTVLRATSDGLVAVLAIEWAGRELRSHVLAGRGLARSLRPGATVLLSVRPEDVHLIAREEDASAPPPPR